MMKDQDNSRDNGTLYSIFTPTISTIRTRKKKEKNTPPVYPLTPDSSPSSVEETETNKRPEVTASTTQSEVTARTTQSEVTALAAHEKDMSGQLSHSPTVTESKPSVDAASSPEINPPFTAQDVTSSGDGPPNKDEPRLDKIKDPKLEAGARRPRAVNKSEGNIPEVVSPSVPKQKVRRAFANSESGQLSVKPKPASKKKTQPEQVQKNTITNYYQVRRSGRQTKSEIEKAKQHQLEQQILSHCEDGLEIKYFENKGRGIVATKNFQKGDFVVEYAGDLIDPETAKLREKTYAETPEVGCYMYYFCCTSKQYCIDATAESQYLGRLVNHSREGNCCTRAVMIDKKPRLFLLASRDIKAGEELTYDYGDRRKEALEQHPWLKS